MLIHSRRPNRALQGAVEKRRSVSTLKTTLAFRPGKVEGLISKLGEFGLIDRLKKSIRLDKSVIKGIGDDCAVLRFNKNKYQLFTCDMLVEGVDFYPDEQPYLIGRKSLAVSASDIAACGGIPHYCLISLALPKDTTVNFVDRIFKGMQDLAHQYKINIVGGDLSRSKKLTIDVCVLGSVKKENLILRDGAKIGDIIYVTGSLGGSIRGKHFKFIPRIRESQFLVKNFKINSMIDISDGLAQDLGQILKESKKGAIIYEDLIPISKQARSLKDALYSGEDFELLFTLSRKGAKKLYARNPVSFKPIGEITEDKYGLRLIDKKGKERVISPRGFRHF